MLKVRGHFFAAFYLDVFLISLLIKHLSCFAPVYFCKVFPSQLCTSLSHCLELFTCFSLESSSSLGIVGLSVGTILQFAGVTAPAAAFAGYVVNAVSTGFPALGLFLCSLFALCCPGFPGSAFMHKAAIRAFYSCHAV